MSETPEVPHLLVDEPPPFLGTWPRVYALVLLFEAIVIAVFYGFTRFFA